MDFEPGQASWQLGYRINRVELALRAQMGELRAEVKELRNELTLVRDQLMEQLQRTHALVELGLRDEDRLLSMVTPTADARLRTGESPAK